MRVSLGARLATYRDSYYAYFNDNPARDGFVYFVVLLVTVAYSTVSLFSPLLAPPCDRPPDERPSVYPNPDHISRCLDDRYPELLYLSLRECDFVRRCLAALAAGALIGYERRSPDRPAGIRTMAVTALGSASFTLASMYAFQDGPMAWDASRVSAAIPSGVGFLGSGIIWKGMVGDGMDALHEVHGLTTAASLWLSAAVGVVIGGGMYFIGFFTVMVSILVLRFGPRSSALDEHEHACMHGQHEPRGAPPSRSELDLDSDGYTPPVAAGYESAGAAAAAAAELGVAESSSSAGASAPLLLASLTPRSEAASSQRLFRRKSAAVMKADF